MVADKATLSALSGDPRRPDLVVPFKAPPAEEKMDALTSIAMLLGIAGMWLKLRVLNFIALAFIASAFMQRGPDTDSKQIFISGTFAVVGIFFQHLQPPPGAVRAPANVPEAAGAAAAAVAGAQATGQT